MNNCPVISRLIGICLSGRFGVREHSPVSGNDGRTIHNVLSAWVNEG